MTFVAVLGDDSDWLADYEAAEYTDVDLWIPKLDTESAFGREMLVQYLMDRGAVDAFNANTADFSRMAGLNMVHQRYFAESQDQDRRGTLGSRGSDNGHDGGRSVDGAGRSTVQGVPRQWAFPVLYCYHADADTAGDIRWAGSETGDLMA